MASISHQPPSGDLPALDGRHSGNLIRLGRLLEYPGRFRLVIAEHNTPPDRDRIIERLAHSFPRTATRSVSPDLSAGDFIECLRGFAVDRDAIQVIGIEDWSPEAEARFFVGLNYRREDPAAASLSSWCSGCPRERRPASRGRPPTTGPGASPCWTTTRTHGDPRPWPRVPGGRHRAAQDPPAGDRGVSGAKSDGALLLETAHIHERLGEWDQALQAAEQAFAIYRDNDDQRSTAVIQGQIADILQKRGQLDEALCIRTQEELPVYERLGNVHGILACRTKIALTLLARQETDERAQANALLCLALTDTRRLRVPEAQQIEAILQQFGMACP